jgi:hypothetical protein
MSTGLDQSLLVAALEGFEAQLARLELQIAQVKQLTSGKKVRAASPVAAAPQEKGKRKKRREVSEDGRRRMAEAQKRRWAAARG